LDDSDLQPLCEALKAGLPLSMLKLAANRISDGGVASLVEAILKMKSPTLGVLDLSNNRVCAILGLISTTLKVFRCVSETFLP